MTVFTASIATASDCVAGDNCDLQVTTEDFTTTVLETVELDVPTSDDDAGTKAAAQADAILEANGFNRVSDWDSSANALYATVERTA